MASTPNGSVVDEINSGKDGPPPPKGSAKDGREWITSLTPKGHRSDRDRTGGVGGACSHGGYDPDFLGPPQLHRPNGSSTTQCWSQHQPQAPETSWT